MGSKLLASKYSLRVSSFDVELQKQKWTYKLCVHDNLWNLINRTFLINLLHVSFFNFFLLFSITRNAIWGNYRPLQQGRSKYEVKVIWIKTLQAFAPILSHGFISILSEKVDKALVFWCVQGILKWKTDVKCVNKQNSNGKFRPATLLKADFNADDFLWNLRDFEEDLFWRTSTNDCFWFLMLNLKSFGRGIIVSNLLKD